MIKLCNPNRKALSFVSHAINPIYKPRLHGASEFSFKIYNKYNDNNGKQSPVPYYEYLVKNRLLAISTDFAAEKPNIEWFIIHEANVFKDNPKSEYKEILAYSYEKKLSRNNADFLDGTYQFYNPTKPEGTMMQKIVDAAPAWSIGHVDASLYSRFRTFSDIEDTLYGFMLNDCEEAYDCLFTFDTDRLLINAYDATDYVKRSNVILTFQNVIKNVQINNDGEEIITALSVRGGGSVSIYDVNPTGDNYIYNFSHYKDTKWISQGLIDALTAWESNISANKQNYSNLLTNLKVAKADLTKLEGEMVDLSCELAAIEQVRTAQYPNILAETTNQYNAKKAQIWAKEQEISSKKSSIDTINKQLDTIVANCKISNNFTNDLLAELQTISYQGEYVNENFITTDLMDYAAKQEVAEQLYARGETVSAEKAKPQYTFSMDTLNFLFIEKFAKYASELTLGKSINVEIKEDEWTYPILLELEIHYDDPTQFNMFFGTRLRMEKDCSRIAETLHESTITSAKVDSKSSVWDIPVKSGMVDRVTEYMNNSLDAALQEIVSNSNDQSVTIGSYGLRTMKINSNGSIDPKQLWMRNGMIAMTNDAWQSVKLAIGEINGVYSVNAEVIAGKLLAGNTLTITNEKGTFTVDDRVLLRDLDLELTNGSNKITLKPFEGFRMISGGSTKVDMNMATGKFNVADMDLVLTKGNNKITLDADNGLRFMVGNATKLSLDMATGNALINEITATSGSIGGWEITPDRLRNTATGEYIGSDGYGKLGNLTWNPASSTFTGTVYGHFVNWNSVNNNNNPIPNNAYGDSSISTRVYQDGSIIPAKLDRVYADIGQFNSLSANVAEIGTLAASKASIADLNALKATIDKLMAGEITSNALSTGDLYFKSLWMTGSSGGELWPVKTCKIKDTNNITRDVLYVGY